MNNRKSTDCIFISELNDIYDERHRILTDVHFAFNIWDFESAKAVIDAAASVGQDVILQTSSGVYKNLPARPFSNFVKSYSAFKGIHTWLNLDHCKEKEILYSAVDSGWDLIMADGSSMLLSQNIAFTTEITKYAHSQGVLVEAEVGQVKGIEDDVVVQQDAIASREDIDHFLSSTDVDLIAVAFGNAHGEYRIEPNLHYDLVEYTTSITDKPFVVHGGSGLSDKVLSRLIGIDGVKKLNISTDLKMAYRRAFEKSVASWAQPIDASNNVHNEIMTIAISKMNLLISGGK